MIRIGTQVHVFEAGAYAIGDPCYIINDDDWNELIKDTGHFGSRTSIYRDTAWNWNDGSYFFKREKCFAYSTYVGDGEYYLEDEGKKVETLGVDSGLLGIMPENVAIKNKYPFTPWVHYHTFEDDFEVMRTVDGVFYFGYMRVQT